MWRERERERERAGKGGEEEEEEDQRHSEFLTPSAFLFGSPELNPFGQTVYRGRKITMGPNCI